MVKIRYPILFFTFFLINNICLAAPVYGPNMPKRSQWYMGFETNLVFDRDMRKGLGEAEARQFFFDTTYGIYDWFSFDGRLGIGDMECDTIEAGHLDYDLGFSGAYGVRFRVYNDESNKLRSVLGFQHISAHPPRKEVNSVKYSAIWDEWQFSLLLAKGFAQFEPYAGIKVSQLYIIRRNNVQNEWAWNGSKGHFGIFLGSSVDLSKDIYLEAEGRFIDETAFSAALIYKL